MKTKLLTAHGPSALSERIIGLKSALPLSTADLVRHLEERGDASVHLRDDHVHLRGRVESGVGVLRGGDAVPEFDADDVAELMALRGMTADADVAATFTRWWASDERVDSYGDIIRQSWDMTAFEKNSPMPYGHRWNEPPIGRHLFWDVLARKEKGYEGPSLLVGGVFDLGQAMGKRVHRLVSKGFLPSGSVGFMPLEAMWVEDDDERESLGLGKYGLLIQRSQLLEFSPVTVPANHGAHIAKMGSWADTREVTREDLADLRMICQAVLRDQKNEAAWDELDAGILELHSQRFPTDARLERRSIEQELDQVPEDGGAGQVVVIKEPAAPAEDPAELRHRELCDDIAALMLAVEKLTERVASMEARFSAALRDCAQAAAQASRSFADVQGVMRSILDSGVLDENSDDEVVAEPDDSPDDGVLAAAAERLARLDAVLAGRR